MCFYLIIWLPPLLVTHFRELRLKGKITLPAPFIDLGSLFFTWGEQKALDYITKLKGQNINVTTGGTTCLTKVINGEMAVGASSMYTAIGQYKAAGAADFIDWLPMSPQLVTWYPMYTFKGSPHPNTAKLMMAWLNTPEGIAATTASGRGALDSPTPVEAFKIIKAKGIQIFHENTMEISKTHEQYRMKIIQLLGYVPGK
jgi:ABC-type Fe3+ transport system substrate-binding protein